MLVFTNDGMKLALDLLGGSADLAVFRLFKNDREPSPLDVIGDYTEADFAGYGAQTAVWSGSFINALGTPQINASSVTWLSTGALPANTIYGYYCTNAGNTKVWFAKRLPFPIPVNAAGIPVFVQPAFTNRNQA